MGKNKKVPFVKKIVEKTKEFLTFKNFYFGKDPEYTTFIEFEKYQN